MCCTHSQSQRPSLGLPASPWTHQLRLWPTVEAVERSSHNISAKRRRQKQRGCVMQQPQLHGAGLKGHHMLTRLTQEQRLARVKINQSNVEKVLIQGVLEDALLKLLGQLQPLLQLMVCRLHGQGAPGPPACIPCHQ